MHDNETTVGAKPSLTSRAVALLRDVGELASDHLELATLEAQRAAIVLTKILCGAVVISILIVSAWLALMAGGIVWATAEGISWSGALAVAAGLNLLVAAAIAYWIRRSTGELLFSATLRQLRLTTQSNREELT
jgi:uncharacterized membrane protein YqjE